MKESYNSIDKILVGFISPQWRKIRLKSNVIMEDYNERN